MLKVVFYDVATKEKGVVVCEEIVERDGKVM